MNITFKTKAEQSLAHIKSLSRPLTDDESDLLRRSLHAVYCRNRCIAAEKNANAPILSEHRKEELKTLRKVEAEMRR